MSSERDTCLRKADDAKQRAAQAREPFIKSAYEKVEEYWMVTRPPRVAPPRRKSRLRVAPEAKCDTFRKGQVHTLLAWTHGRIGAGVQKVTIEYRSAEDHPHRQFSR